MATTDKIGSLVVRGTGRAGRIENSNRQRTAANPAAREESGFDVWTYTADGASSWDPTSGDAGAGLYETFHSDLPTATGDQVGDSMGDQGSSIVRSFELLTGTGAEPGPGEQAPEGFLGNVGAAFELLTSVEQLISAPLSMIPFPAFPAIRVLDMDVGLPHAHNHAPNLIPPAPPVPLPSTGPIIPIPFLSGANKTLVNGMPAGRCGDMGLGIWCGGFFPMYEVFLGSSSVWIEGARAGRLLVDITKHCIFTSPKPQDPPMGPMTGLTIMSSPNVLIGGVPMPSLLSFAIGLAIRGLMQGLGRGVRALRAMRSAADDVGEAAARSADDIAEAGARSADDLADSAARSADDLADDVFEAGDTLITELDEARRFVDELESSGAIRIGGDDAFQRAVREDLRRVVDTPTGRRVFEDVQANHATRGNRVDIEPLDPRNPDHARIGPHCDPANADAFRAADGTPGSGSDSTIRYNAGEREYMPHDDGYFEPDELLLHEGVHARNAGRGEINSHYHDPSHPDADANGWVQRPSPEPDIAPNPEELDAVQTESAYRREQGYPERPNYDSSGRPGEHVTQEMPAFGDADTMEMPASEAPTQEIPASEAPTEEIPVQDAPTEEFPAQDAPTEEMPAQDAPTEEIPASEAPTEEIPAQDAPTEEIPASEAPTEEMPAADTDDTIPGI